MMNFSESIDPTFEARKSFVLEFMDRKKSLERWKRIRSAIFKTFDYHDLNGTRDYFEEIAYTALLKSGFEIVSSNIGAILTANFFQPIIYASQCLSIDQLTLGTRYPQDVDLPRSDWRYEVEENEAINLLFYSIFAIEADANIKLAKLS